VSAMRKAIWKRKILVLLASFLCLGQAHCASFAAPRMGGEKEVVETFIATVSRPDTQAKSKNSFNDAAQSMDFEEMARRSFGESEWMKFTAEEQKEVTVLFRRLMQVRFYPRWRRVFQNGHYQVTAVTRHGDDSLVSGKLNSQNKYSDLSFRLIKRHDGFKLISMAVKDKDLLERTSVRLKRGLKNRGAKGLIAHLKKKTAEISPDSSDKAALEELISGGK